MPRGWVRVTAFHPNGMVTLEDGREMQAIMASNGALGVRKAAPQDHEVGIDQSGAIPDRTYFDISALDQT
jgi:ribosomal protein S11